MPDGRKERRKTDMKMQNAEITFITFDALDVIATSGGFSYLRLDEIGGFESFSTSFMKATYRISGGMYYITIDEPTFSTKARYYQLNDGYLSSQNHVHVNATELGTAKPDGGTQITTWASLVDWIRGNSSHLR